VSRPRPSPERVAAHAALVAARARRATPGPWGYDRAGGAVVTAAAAGLREVAGCCHDPDATFIAHARADVPWLLGQLTAEQHARAALERRLAVLVTAVGLANRRSTACRGRATGCATWSPRARPPPRWSPRFTPPPAPWTPRPSASRTAPRDRAPGCGLGRRLPSAASAAGPATPIWEGVVAGLS
jgi:hypothetical protein